MTSHFNNIHWQAILHVTIILTSKFRLLLDVRLMIRYVHSSNEKQQKTLANKLPDIMILQAAML